MRSRKANITLNMIVNIVLAVLAIIILLYLATGLYGIFTKKSKLEQARSVLDEIVLEIQGLEVDEESSYLVTSPKNWFLVLDLGKLCICAKDNLFEANDCCLSGASEKVENVVFEESCFVKGFILTNRRQNCISFEELPKIIYFNNDEGIVNIKSTVLAGILEEFLGYEKEGAVLGDLIESGVSTEHMIDNRKQVEGMIDTFFQEKGYKFYIEARANVNHRVFAYGDYKIQSSKDPKTSLTYEFEKEETPYIVSLYYN